MFCWFFLLLCKEWCNVKSIVCPRSTCAFRQVPRFSSEHIIESVVSYTYIQSLDDPVCVGILSPRILSPQ